ncbi:hypothetical protein ABH944_004099 [Caballeronia udeis]|uniref:Uncharacterized protein n=1 Tax=Caballeronia udeis TaxID=1232866 RepID=A0ABW8MPZ5_9BURK
MVEIGFNRRNVSQGMRPSLGLAAIGRNICPVTAKNRPVQRGAQANRARYRLSGDKPLNPQVKTPP